MHSEEQFIDQLITEKERQQLYEYQPEIYQPDWFNDVQTLLEMRLDDVLTPKYLARADDTRAIYPGTHTAIYGAPGTGKTMLAKYASHQAILEGHRVLHVDLDDNLPQVLAQDVYKFGTPKDMMVKLWNLAQPDSVERLTAIWNRVIGVSANILDIETIKANYDIVIIDSMAGLEGIVNADTNGSLEFVKNIYLPWVKTLMNAGIAVITVDHTAKDPHARGAAGSIQKLAKADLAINVVAPQDSQGLVPGITSSVALYIDKDRYGVTKAASQLREYKHGQRVMFGTFTIPAQGLAFARIDKPADLFNPEYDF